MTHYNSNGVPTSNSAPKLDELKGLWDGAHRVIDQKRRTRILALEAASRVCSSLMTPFYKNDAIDPGFRTVNDGEVAAFVVNIARTFEGYIDGDE